VVWGRCLGDGHNRYEICHKHGIGFTTFEKSGLTTKGDVKIWMIQNQIEKRNTTSKPECIEIPVTVPCVGVLLDRPINTFGTGPYPGDKATAQAALIDSAARKGYATTGSHHCRVSGAITGRTEWPASLLRSCARLGHPVIKAIKTRRKRSRAL
jgi:hypothetical protein